MSALTILAVAFGLAVDAFAAALSRGCLVARSRLLSMALLIGLLFGGFQALMPLIGWRLGDGARAVIADWDHWVAFVILAGIGGKTVFEGLTADPYADRADSRTLTFSALIVTAIATSVDALAAGFGFALVDTDMWSLIAVTGGVTFVLSWMGVQLGCRVGALFGSRVEIVGGLVLVGIGANILYQHLTA